jgi:hypothetical protein
MLSARGGSGVMGSPQSGGGVGDWGFRSQEKEWGTGAGVNPQSNEGAGNVKPSLSQKRGW